MKNAILSVGVYIYREKETEKKKKKKERNLVTGVDISSSNLNLKRAVPRSEVGGEFVLKFFEIKRRHNLFVNYM